MTGSLQIKHKKYYMVFSFKKSDGTWGQKSECTGLLERGNKRKAEAMLEERLKELNQTPITALENRDIKFLDFMRMWLDDVIQLTVKPNTLHQYHLVFENSISKFPAFDVPLCKLTAPMIQAYIREKIEAGVSPKTIRKHCSNIRKCLDYALKQDLILYNPADRITLPRLNRYTGAVVLSAEELQKLLLIFKDDPLETVVWLAVCYGLRRSEALGLAWESVDFSAKQIRIEQVARKVDGKIVYVKETKTESSRRTLPLTPNVERHLLEAREKQRELKRRCGQEWKESDLVCMKLHRNGALSGIDPDFVTHHFQRVTKAHGITCRFHDLRHSAVNALRLGGCDVKRIAEFIGHSSVTTTLAVYSHLMAGEMTDMGAIMDQALFSAPVP